MAWFSRRSKASRSMPPASPLRSIGLEVLGGLGGWALLTGPAAGRSDREVRCDDETLAARLPEALRSAWGVAQRTGIGPLREDAAAHEWVGGDWVGVTATGIRAFTVALGAAGLTVMRFGLTFEGPSGDAHVEPTGRRSRDMLADPDLANWAEVIDGQQWSSLAVWDRVAAFLRAGVQWHGLVGGWWTPDPLDFSVPIAPLREEFVKDSVSPFLYGTEWKPDAGGPPAQGFADPGVTGRWLWLYQWRPFATGDTFPAAFGLVLGDDGPVRAYYWPDRANVQRVLVRRQDAWAVQDRTRITGLFGELAGAVELPPDWTLDRV